MPPFAANKPPPKSSAMPPWLVLTALALAGLLAVALGLWLLWGGTATVMSWLPTSLVRSVSEKAGDPKVVEQQPDPEGAPWKSKAYVNQDRVDGDKADDPDKDLPAEGTADKADPQHDAAVAQAALAPITEAAAAVDRAIEAWQKKPGDQALLLVAEKAIESLRTTSVHAGTAALRQAALEQRGELVNQKRKALEDAQRQIRASHRITAKSGAASMRQAADDKSEEVAQLPDDTSVHLFLDTGHGWSRIEVLTGEAAGKNGYVRNRNLEPVHR